MSDNAYRFLLAVLDNAEPGASWSCRAAGDGRWVALYSRTAKRVQPVHVDVPGTLFEVAS